jgi:hypothetical protein
MTQSRKQSFIEALANIAIGYSIMVAAQAVIYPAFAINIPLETNLKIGACFTVVSIARTYTIRRFFNMATKPKWR